MSSLKLHHCLYSDVASELLPATIFLSLPPVHLSPYFTLFDYMEHFYYSFQLYLVLYSLQICLSLEIMAFHLLEDSYFCLRSLGIRIEK